MDRERLKGNLDLLLLSVLSAGPAHGYAIISALRERSEGTFDLPEGTIYPALHRLEDSGLLASSWAQAEGRRRQNIRTRHHIIVPAVIVPFELQNLRTPGHAASKTNGRHHRFRRPG